MSREPRKLILLTDDGAITAPPARVRAGLETLPTAIAAAGAQTSERFIEFFTANIRNRNTRMAYAMGVRQFFNWCEDRSLQLEAIKPRTIAAYIEQLGTGMAPPRSNSTWRPFGNCSTTWSRAADYPRIPPVPCAVPNTL